MEEAVKLLKSKKPREIKKGLKELAEISKSLPEAIKECKGAE